MKTVPALLALAFPFAASAQPALTVYNQDFAVVRTMVFVGSLLYIATYALIDIAYTWVDPRVRLA